ncbi:Hypothetical predicted protein [Podarcis lilfordi]|uniref:Uncharacterized protein n=1 Tax=Podarcis lilfordi TaxID=74358 RepID=A0AA35PQD1_9SAUR|nr:Hypothetical predicted protein [Podarcis lilfordi]
MLAEPLSQLRGASFPGSGFLGAARPGRPRACAEGRGERGRPFPCATPPPPGVAPRLGSLPRRPGGGGQSRSAVPGSEDQPPSTGRSRGGRSAAPALSPTGRPAGLAQGESALCTCSGAGWPPRGDFTHRFLKYGRRSLREGLGAVGRAALRGPEACAAPLAAAASREEEEGLWIPGGELPCPVLKPM